ncbi:alpha/beta hydrolase [Schumannella sp. 10F1B-5-1]|uniref:alpha/beta hydrolase n=1 Tax=Schumannella sp. 10F1B-5-1 TaxID=2590780 RepID=UPI001130D272|nr:alpha/beta fold hydrolase [Schumannella sp. 10F1B-5-1]TPW70887.1 lysophospholipase [Schumannella sp. 10F1B-5-1]
MASGQQRRGSSARRGLAIGGAVAIGVVAGAALLGAGVAGLGAVVARTVITPPKKRPDDVRILDVDEDAGEITLSRNHETEVDGRYGMWFAGDTGYVRLGDVVALDDDTVTRRIERVVFGDLASASGGRWSGWYYLTPRDLGHDYRDVSIDTELGAAPAWLIPAEGDAERDGRWAVLVHGRAVKRAETLRAVDTFHEAGYTVLAISYRNDGDAPASPDGRYALGDREWVDVDAALGYAVASGARDVVLMGWSMGGATVLQTITRSPRADVVRGVVLESPVVDWTDTIDHQVVTVRGMPGPLSRLVERILGEKRATPLTGLERPVDLARLNFVDRAGELHLPMLVLHSDDDQFVPSRASRALAVARPDIVRYEPFDTAQHTRLWNYAPVRWTTALREFLSSLA